MRLHNDQVIKKWESLELEAYLPTPDDVWTIGWGHTHTAYKGQTISRREAQELFDKDVQWAEDAVNDNVTATLTQNQFDALVSFVFNLGEANFKRSTLLRKLNKGDYQGAAEQLPRWNKQKTPKGLVVLKGLTRRRAEEMELFLSDDVDQPKEGKQVQNPDKPLWQSKEVIGGAVTALTGTAAQFGSWDVTIQQQLLDGLGICLLVGGLYLVGNRLLDRYKGTR